MVNFLENHTAHIARHRRLAEESLKKLQEEGKIKAIRKKWMESDGWGDGFKTLHAEIEMPNGRQKIIRWSDGNKGWMEKLFSGGWGILEFS